MRFETPDRDPRRWASKDRGHPRGNLTVPPSSSPDAYPPTRCPELTPPPPARPLFAGRYEIVKELGRGGMGVVSQARDTRLPRDVAIKVPLHLRGADSLRRFLKEAEAAAQLDHPNIGRILDLGEADGLPYIVLAFIPGRTLAEILERRPVEPTRAAKLARSVARTIQFAHDRGIIHRDLKPANLMLGPRHELIVMDFGLARLEGEERKTLTGQVFGTLPYMSPEQVQGRAVDMGKGCDIYALGVIFYELLTGRLPFRGEPWELPQQIVRVAPLPPSKARPDLDLDWELDAIVLKAMAKEIRDRYASMGEFAGAIADYLRRVGSLSDSALMRPRAEGAPVRLTPADDPGSAEVPFRVRLRPEPLLERRRSRFKIWDLVAWVSIAALVVLGLDVFLKGEKGENELPQAPAIPSKIGPAVTPAGGGTATPTRRPQMPGAVQASRSR